MTGVVRAEWNDTMRIDDEYLRSKEAAQHETNAIEWSQIRGLGIKSLNWGGFRLSGPSRLGIA